jgi:hypothetical protein
MVIDLGVYVGSNNSVQTFYTALNNAGQVAGYNAVTGTPVLWQNGTVTPLAGVSASETAVPAALNDYGQIALTLCSPVQPAIWQNGILQRC